MNFTITRYQLGADMTPGKRFVRIGQHGHSLRIWWDV